MRQTGIMWLTVGLVMTPAVILILGLTVLDVDLPPRASPVNILWRDLYDTVQWIAFVVAAVVFGAIAFILIRFRAKAGGPQEGPHIHGNTKMEIAWTIAPTIIMAWLLVLSFNGLSMLDQPPEEEGTIENEDWIKVQASQFSWKFTYSDGNTSSGALRIEQNRLIGFEITSTDVIHAFSVPDLGIMKDAVPGRTTYSWVRALVPGNYTVKCRELCGVGHSKMLGTVEVFPEGSQGDRHWGEAAAPAVSPSPTPSPTAGGNETGGRTIEVQLSPGFKIDPAKIEGVGVGERISFSVKNADSLVHNLFIGTYDEGKENHGANWSTEDLAKDETATLSFTFGGDATFEFWCDEPGHRFGYLEGMSGELDVGNGSAGPKGSDLLLPGLEPIFALGGVAVAAAIVLVRRRR